MKRYEPFSGVAILVQSNLRSRRRKYLSVKGDRLPNITHLPTVKCFCLKLFTAD